MQPTKSQVQCSLNALRHEPSDPTSSTVLSTSEGEVTAERPFHDTVGDRLGKLSSDVLEHLAETPDVRSDRVEVARDHIEHGDVCSADELADHIIGRLVCDRLR